MILMIIRILRITCLMSLMMSLMISPGVEIFKYLENNLPYGESDEESD